MDGKPVWASRTIWFNVLALVILVASSFGFVEFKADPWVQGVAPAVVLVVNLVLRFLTERPVKF